MVKYLLTDSLFFSSSNNVPGYNLWKMAALPSMCKLAIFPLKTVATGLHFVDVYCVLRSGQH